MSRKGLRGAIAVAVAAILVVPAVAAEEVSRDSYREAVEPICRENTRANERIFKGVRAMVRNGELKRAARQFQKAATALEGTVAQLRRVPRPPEDEDRLIRWLDTVSTEASLFEAVAAKLRAGKKAAAVRLVVRLTSTATKANSMVISFEFRFCRLEPSRFT